MNLTTKLATAVIMAGGVSMAQATTFNVAAVFSDGSFPGATTFNGSFDWDGATLSNFSGFLDSSMWNWQSATQAFDSNGSNLGGMLATATSRQCGAPGACLADVYDKNGAAAGLGYANNEIPLLHLTYDQLVPATVSGNLVTATVFFKNNTLVESGGGYDVINNPTAYGYPNNANRTNNGLFTLVFDALNPTAQETRDIDPSDPSAGTFQTATTTDEMIYADQTRLAMMGGLLNGWIGMTGFNNNGAGGSMGGFPYSLDITCTGNGPCNFVAPVPIPAAAWLFGGAILGMLGVSRRKSNSLA